jgi:hypothetical protein
MASNLLHSVAVYGPHGKRVQVLFYEDESIRFRIYDSPLVIEEAFLTGNKGQNSIIKVSPRSSTN